VLGLSKTASADEIKSSFRQLAKKWHPDRNPNNKVEAEEKFKEIAEAYGVLSDEQKRAAYDQYGHAGVSGPAGGGGYQNVSVEDILNQFFGGRGGGGGSGSIFDEMFGGQGGGRESAQGASLRWDMELTLEQAYKGVEKTIEINREELCDTCSGSGAKAGTKPVACSYCRGSGYVTRSQGFFTMRTACGRCAGRGEVVESPCTTCKGSGRQPKKVKINLKVPAGVHDNMRMTLQGQGEPGPDGGSRGNLIVMVHVKNHEIFDRHENDILMQATIPYTTAVLGGEIEVPTLEGRARLNIPKGTQSGRMLKMGGLGMPDVHGYGKGNQLVRVVVDVPKKVSAEQEELLRQLAILEKAQVASQKRSLFGKIKDFFSEE